MERIKKKIKEAEESLQREEVTDFDKEQIKIGIQINESYLARLKQVPVDTIGVMMNDEDDSSDEQKIERVVKAVANLVRLKLVQGYEAFEIKSLAQKPL